MGRKRKHNRGLPERVYRRHGAYYYVHQDGRWERLGDTIPDAYGSLAKLHKPTELRTVADLISRYVLEVTPTKSRASQIKDRRYSAILRDVFGDESPRNIKPSDIERFLKSRPKKVQANREKALLSHIFTKAVIWDAADFNPCLRVGRNEEAPRQRYVEDWELWAVVRNGGDLLRRYLAVLYFTGQRPSDVISLRRDQLGRDGIMFTQAKTGRKVLVLWSPALRQLTAGSGTWVFQNGDAPYSYWAMNSAFRRALKKALAAGDLTEPFRLQDIRPKAASDGPDLGLLGHASRDFARRVYMRRPIPVKPVQ